MTTPIDGKLTWTGMLDVLLLLVREGSPEGRALAHSQLQNMAKLADAYARDHAVAEAAFDKAAAEVFDGEFTVLSSDR